MRLARSSSPELRLRMIRVEVVDALQSLGGAARPGQLQGLVSRRAIEAAVGRGEVVRGGRILVLPLGERPTTLAVQLRGVLSHRSAAAHWRMALPPDEAGSVHVTIPHKAKRKHVPGDVSLHYRDVPDGERSEGVTSALRTVLDCLRDEPLHVAICVGDSALRQQLVTYADLAAAVERLSGRGSRQVRLRLAMLDARAENAFESTCRAILLGGGITGFEPQVVVRRGRQWVGRVDLAHRTLRIVIECDGFETHGGRDAFVRDLLRHSDLAAAGWRTLRFTWEQVMFRPDWVLQCVRDVIAQAA